MKKYVRIIDNKVQAIFEEPHEGAVLMTVPDTFLTDNIAEYEILENEVRVSRDLRNL